MKKSADVILVGGGLANGLLAWRLRQLRPELKIKVFEKGPALGGQHTWSFHSQDLLQDELSWLAPLIRKSWPGYSVHFPRHERMLTSGYHSISSDRFHEVIAPVLGEALYLGASVRSMTPTTVTLEDGSNWEGAVVVDGRGPAAVLPEANGYQKFVGLDVTLTRPHGLKLPVLMDARCPQRDGFRFFYLLPWSENSLLVEDTRYSNSPKLDLQELTQEIHHYIQAVRGWEILSVDRTENGVLPIPMRRIFAAPDLETLERASGGPVKLGMRSDLFHFTTGYSLPWAVRTARSVALLSKFSPEILRQHMENQRVERNSLNSNAAFCRFLNRMLFQAADPAERYRILERFYRLSAGLIQRFYSENLTSMDYARILMGKPPVAIHRALRCIGEFRKAAL